MTPDIQNYKQFTKIEKILLKKPLVVIIHVTDTYFIEETTVNGDVDLPGFARLYSLIDFIKSNPHVKNNGIPVLILHGGDFLFPSLMSVYFKGQQMIDVLNACSFDYCTIGNHDFDGGKKHLNTRMAEATFDVVCANIKSKKNIPSLRIREYVICQNRNNQPFVAIVGIAGKATLRKAQQNGFDVFPIKSLLKQVIAKIRERYPKLNHLIVLSHMNNQEDVNLKEWLNKNWKGYAYLLGGHDHNEILQYNKNQPKSILVKGQSNCRTVQILGLHDGKNYQDTKWFEKNILVLHSKVLSDITTNPKIQKIVMKWENLLEKHLKEKESDEIIKQFDKNTVLNATELDLRKGSTNFGNFIADCMSEFTKSDLAFVNSGHFRGDRKMGSAIKLSDLRRVFVLDKKDALVKITMTNAECKKFLKHAYSEEGRGKVLQVSKNVIKVLQKSTQKDKFTVVMLWDMLKTDDDGFTTILANSRKTTVSKLQSKLKKHIISNSSLFDVIRLSSKDVKYDSKIRMSVNSFKNYF
ncbi:MAG: 5'-nucleotidase C-terminal domain-containing protein [Nitrosopumilus sp.]|nr:5'-nucleotidase C-terminal domain-containing protein [Nitrosopumilus sp.]